MLASLWPLLYSHNAWVGTTNLFCCTKKISKGKHIRHARVLAHDFAVPFLVPQHAWVGLFKCTRRLVVEIKRMEPAFTGSMRIAALANLQLAPLTVVYLGKNLL